MDPLTEDRDGFVRTVVRIRNDFTHWTPRDNAPRPDTELVLRSGQRLDVLLQSALP
jgi:hypothetical protein